MYRSNTTGLRAEAANRIETTGKITIALMILSGLVLFTSVIIFTTALFYDVEREEVIKKRAIGNLEVQEFRQLQQQRLTEYSWIDQSSGVVGIPVGRAIEILINEKEGNLSGETSEPQNKSRDPQL